MNTRTEWFTAGRILISFAIQHFWRKLNYNLIKQTLITMAILETFISWSRIGHFYTEKFSFSFLPKTFTSVANEHTAIL